MISDVKRYCCEDISLIENYDLAIADNTQTWHCHHRLEIDLNKTPKELKVLGLYYHRPASELKFMTPHDHNSLHKTGTQRPEELKRKHSELMKGEGNPMYGKSQSEESKRKNSEAHKNKKQSEETKRKRSEKMKGRKTWNTGKTGCYSEETLEKKRRAMLGKHRVYHEDGSYHYER